MQHLSLGVNNDETFPVTYLGRNVNKPNVSMLLFTHVYYKGGGLSNKSIKECYYTTT